MTGWLIAALAVASTPANRLLVSTTSQSASIVELIDIAAGVPPTPEVRLGGGTPLSLVRVAEAVETHHPLLAAAEQRRRQAEGKALSARGGFDPVLAIDAGTWPEGFYDLNRLEAKIEQATPVWGASVFGSYRIGVGRIPVYEEERRTLDEGEIKAGISVPLWRDGPIDARRAEIRQTQAGAEAAQFDRETVRLDLLLQGAAAYWKWALAGQSYRIARDLVRLAETRDRQLAEKVRRGAVAEIDRAENLRAVLDRRQDLVAAQRQLEQTAIKVGLFLRSDDGQPRVPSAAQLPALPEPTIPPREELERGRNNALARRPEMAFYRAEVRRAEVGLRLADNQVAPDIDFNLSVAKDLGTEPDDKTFDSLDPTEFKLGVTLKMPFFLRKERGKQREAEAKLSEVNEKARFQRDKLETQVLNLWAALNAQAQQSRLADETYRIAEAVAAAERRRFDLGATTLFIVNLREQKAAEAARKRVKARADYAVTRSAWMLATETALFPGLQKDAF